MRKVTKEECLQNLIKAKEDMKELMVSKQPSKFKQNCEETFTNFRQAVVHLRDEREMLDSVTEKEVTWRFLCRMAQEVPYQSGRCAEVVRYLLISDSWVKAFANDDRVNTDQLPPAVKDEVDKRLGEVEPDPPPPKADQKTDPWSKEPKAGYPQPKAKSDPWSKPGPAPKAPATIGGMPQLCATSMSIVVQRCLSAKISTDRRPGNQEIGNGLVISVSMADGATEEGVKSAAQFILTAKLSGMPDWYPSAKGLENFGDGAVSVASLCRSGHHQGIMVVPQPSLVADIQDGQNVSRDLAYKRSMMQSKMFDSFVLHLRNEAPELVEAAPVLQEGSVPGSSKAVEVVAAEFGSNIRMNMSSAGPFMHSFQF
jgi:D-Tyr-tRNAtyr deacylase